METGCLSVKSKAKYEWNKIHLRMKLFKSVEILKKNYDDQSKNKQIKGYIQMLNKFPL